jgi:hypothetical protein
MTAPSKAVKAKAIKALDQWARDCGYNDFDTYVRAGGSIIDAVEDIRSRIRKLEYALIEIGPMDPRPILPFHPPKPPESPETVTEDETPDPDNAQVQGAEFTDSHAKG